MIGAADRARPESWGLLWGSGLTGFGLGGFFDGILLHQVLQWHHLLSAVEALSRADLPVHVFFDGLFHVAMYGITLVGLLLIWKHRGRAIASSGWATLSGGALIGFGVFHIFDGIVFHAVLGLHHIRMDVTNPLPWDLLFFALGILISGVGVLVLRRRE